MANFNVTQNDSAIPLYSTVSTVDHTQLTVSTILEAAYQTPHFIQVLGRNIHCVGLPIIIVIGLVGNTVSLAVFGSSHLRSFSSSVYLLLLNVADLVFLMCLIPVWLSFMEVHIINTSAFVCHASMYLSYASGFLSVWGVVAYSSERLVVVFFPLHRHAWCSKERTIRVITILVVVTMILNSFTFWTVDLVIFDNSTNSTICSFKSDFPYVQHIIVIVDSMLAFIVPSVAILVINISITYRICNFIHKRQGQPQRDSSLQMLSRCTDEPHHRAPPGSPPPDTKNRCMLPQKVTRTTHCMHHSHMGVRHGRLRVRHLRITRTLLMLSTAFLILHSPSNIIRLHDILQNVEPQPASIMVQFLQHVAQIMYYTNFAVNFFLYCAYSHMFRAVLVKNWWNTWHALATRMRAAWSNAQQHLTTGKAEERLSTI